ncbi:DUF4957 domain-containing protein [Aestuariibaculum sediminum]|uniref:DUF5123 domain-containing protein n=1 Tax=Aestuariibaculum sediminum TaxID=2770637 RepID=A0A8J6PY97_9FLAO|nr:DUF5123 domain-containing protein [Aestuariibaculum sediminum]MBD0830828.1 DUF5123 domain-containing protein [Aestuariibaculum sediminum]
MKNHNNIFNIKTILFLCLIVSMFNACDKDDDQNYEKTRLFRPVLNEPLFAEGNSIIVNMGKLKSAVGYTLEVSRDTFATIEYTILSDTNYVEINANNAGEELFWNTIYQVRATAHEADPQYDSKISDLGGVRTETFPSILFSPSSYDVTDVAARVTWEPLGDAITGIKVFAADDLRLTTPLLPEAPVSNEQFLAGEGFVEGLEPESEYQIAIYSGTQLRGWVNFTTRVAEPDYSSIPNLIDIRDNESASAVKDAVASAPDGATILLKRGVTYDLPSTPLDKSITIRAAYGFGEQKAKLFTTGNWNIASGSNIDYIRFIDVEIRGEDYGGDYVFNPSSGDTNVNELLFDNCTIGTLRGVFRLRGTNALVDTYEIRNSVIDSIGGYGLLTCDTNPGTPQTATVNNFNLINSTFNKVGWLIQTRNNCESLTIESCTFANFNNYFRFRGGDGNNNVTNGISIQNSIFGHAWDETGTATTYTSSGVYQGLPDTNFTVGNSFTTSDLTWSTGREIPNLESNYSGTQDDLWVDPQNNDFNFKDKGFAGQYTAGDPRWRTKL